MSNYTARSLIGACLSGTAAIGVLVFTPAWAGDGHVTLPTTHPSQADLETTFIDAATEYGLSPEILKAVAFVESRWVQAGPTIDGGWGIMHLVDNDNARTLQEAATASGKSIETLKTDAVANIHGGAALLANLIAQTTGATATLEDYRPALKAFTGLLPSVQDKQVEEYYRVLSDGARAVNPLGMHLDLPPSTLPAGSATVQPMGSVIMSTDYGPAIWNPAYSGNYGVGRSASIDRWVNHWIGSGTYAGAISWFQNPSANVSAHFVIRKSDGELTQMVRVADTAWHATTYNSRSIGIEHEATPSNPWPTDSSSPMLVNSAACCRYFCDRYAIPRTRSYIVGHNEVPGSSTACPGPLPWDTYMSLVNNGEPPPVTFIVESRSGGQNYANYSETGSWSNSTAKSTASGCTSGLGSRYTIIGANGGLATFNFAPSTTGIYEVFTTNCSTTNSGNPLIHRVYHAGGAATASVCQNSTCASNAVDKWYSLGSYLLNTGTTYAVVLDGTTGSGSLPSGNAGRSDAVRWDLVSSAQPPTITLHPSNQNVFAGETATFTVAATGTGTLTYQWQKNSSNLTNGGHYSGCTTTNLTVTNCDANDVANYRCLVSNANGSAPSNTAALTLQTPPTPLYPREILINYDPIIEAQSGLRLHQVYGWADPPTITAAYASDLSSASHQLMHPRVTQTINADVFPVKTSGFRFTDSGFTTCWTSGGCDATGVDYRAIARDYDLSRRVDAGELDEVLVHGAPYFGYWESTMAGRGGYYCNSGPQVRIPCSKIFIMMGFNYERGVGEMLHSYGHRSESIMMYTYGGYWDITQSRNDWERFPHNQSQSGNAACGSVHWPPNATAEYNYDNTAFVNSTANDWLNNFPNLTGAQTSINREAWGGPDYHRNYMKWWYNHMPHVSGSSTHDGLTRLNNWWPYIQGLNGQPESGGDFAKGGSPPSATPYPTSPQMITANANDDWSPQVNAWGRMVWRGFSGANYQIFSSNIDGSGLVQITSNSRNNEAPKINASGRIVWQAFDGQDYEVFSANSDGTGLVQITNNVYNDWHPQISNTDKIVWDASDGADYEIYSANADGTGIVQLTNNIAASGYPRDDVWPQINNSNRVVWFGYSGNYWQIYSANADGTGLVNVSNNTAENEYPQINDSGRVVWHGWPGAADNVNTEIYSAAATGGSVTRITSNTYEDWYPQISNNGQVVWMSRPAGGKWEVRRANATGGSLATLSPTTHHSQHPRINAGGQVTWQGFDGNDWEIYLWSAGTLYQVTNNIYDDRAASINDSEQLAWHAASVQGAAGDSSEIFSVSRVPPLPGDFDHDGDVDLDDFAVLQRCFSITNPAGDLACAPTDLTGDNAIDQADVGTFIGCASGANIPGDPNCAN